jgi:hypothetical protein
VAVLAVLPDRKQKIVRQFPETIPKRLRRTMETACTGMWEGYVNAVEEFAEAPPEVSIRCLTSRSSLVQQAQNGHLEPVFGQFREELTSIFEMQMTKEEANRVTTLFRRLYLDLEGYRRFT